MTGSIPSTRRAESQGRGERKKRKREASKGTSFSERGGTRRGVLVDEGSGRGSAFARVAVGVCARI